MPKVKIIPPQKQTGGYQRAPMPPQGMYGNYTQEQLNNEQSRTYIDTYGKQTGFDAPMNTPNGFSLPVQSSPVSQPTVNQRAQQSNWYTDEPIDYSIDSVRKDEGLAQYGGVQGKKRVRITPPNDQQSMKWGGNLEGSYNTLDTRWSPVAFQGQIGINPKPDPFATTKRTIPKDPTMQKDYKVGSEYDVSPTDIATIKAMGYTFEMV